MKHFVTALSLIVVLVLIGACGTAPASSSSRAASPANTAAQALPRGQSASPSDEPSTATSAVPALTTAVDPSTSSTAASGANGGQLTVFAAASLTDAFTELGRRFDAANGIQTTFNFAGSQQLAQQLSEGAPADVFASANRAQMERVIEAGQVISGTEHIFVRNRLVVIYPHDNPAQLAALADLAKPNIKIVLAAKEVPVGQYSLDFLAKASVLPQYTAAYSQTVLSNVVSYEDNVRVVLTKVALGEADAGIVYSSDVTQETAAQVARLDIPDELNTIASYPIAPINGSPHFELARKFIEYILSPEGQQVLAEYGFITVVE